MLGTRSARLAAESVALIALLASTWLVVGSSLRHAGPAVVSAGRTGFTVLGLLGLTWWSTGRTPDGPRESANTRYRWWQVVLLGLTGVTAYTVLSTVAIALAGPVLPSLIIALIPAVVLIAESFLNRTRPPLRTIAGTGLAVAGALVYVVPRVTGTLGRDVALGTLSAVGAMLAMAFYGIFFASVNRGYRGAMAPRILPVFLVGSVPLMVWAVAAGDPVGWSAIGLLAALGIIIYVPAYLLQHRILVAAGASYAALLGLAVPPLVGISSAMLGLAGVPTVLQIAGTALTLAGMLLVVLRYGRRSQPVPR